MTIEAVVVDVMGGDISVVNAARVSFGVVREGKLIDEAKDVGLIKFLARERHVTPFRHATVSFRCKAPIAIARQLGKHQVGFSWNEKSRRYKDDGVECYIPDTLYSRPENLHSGSGEEVTGTKRLDAYYWFDRAYDKAMEAYQELLESGIAPEQARFVLPQGMVTEWVWTGSLYGWFEVYRQRSSTHAQSEVRLFAEQIDTAMSELFPVSWAALKATIQ